VAIPQLDSSGLLPTGIHDCALNDLRARFDSFQGSDARPRLMAKLEAFVDEVRASGIVRALVCANPPRLTLSEKLLPISGRRRCDERNLVINRLLAPHLIAFWLRNFRARFFVGRVL